MPNERTPLLWSSFYQDHPSANNDPSFSNAHAQFCMMVGVPSSEPTANGKHRSSSSASPKSLYGRATRQLSSQRFTYYMTASLSNTMLLSQVVLGAALTGLGASGSSHILITVFGAMNTIIAGMVAYLKSRGQPMRARMYRDDLERVVDEIENSEVMWLGISKGVHGYEDIDTGSYKDDRDGERNPNAVTVRSEVARLTRLYERAVRINTVNNPDMYMTGTIDGSYGGAALRSKVGGQSSSLPVSTTAPLTAPVVNVDPGALVAAAPPAAGPVQQPADPDESPATAPPKPKEERKAPKEAKPEARKEEAKLDAKKEDERKGKAKVEGGGGEGDGLSRADTAAENPQGEKVGAGPGDGAGPSEAAKQVKPVQPVQRQDPDAEPASDPNVSLKTVAGYVADGES